MTKQVKTRLRYSLLLALLAASGAFFVSMSASSNSSQAFSLSSGIDQKSFYDANAIQAAYQERGMRPLWIRGQGQFQPRAQAALNILEESWTQGLNPEKYHVAQIRSMMADPASVQSVDLDMLLTDGIVRYSRDLTGMRARNKIADQASFWRQPMPADVILAQLASSADPIKTLHSMEPTGRLYTALRAELIALSKQDLGQNNPIRISKPIKPGKEDNAIPAIRQRLNIPYSGSTPAMYDDELAARVMTLQRQYGLEDNGIITPAVMSIINMSTHDKMMQIIANMERLRWLDQDRPDRYVLVNIPSASLWAVDKGQVALEMPVIVGKTARPTFSFKTEITGVRFNPNWTVPPTIKQTDFLPMLQEDPYVLSKRGIELHYDGKTIDPGKVDWTNVSARGLSNLKMIQDPGDDNPLGKVRVIMENPYNIYLHDTNHRDLFTQKDRTLSSGCIRVSQPEKLADFILSHNDKWSWNGMISMIDSGKMRDVKVQENIPVYITYQTIWLDSEGRLVYGRDVYGQDKKLGQMLEQAGAIKLPTASKDSQISL